MVNPGLRVAREVVNDLRKVPLDEVGEGYVLQDGPEVCPDGDPHLPQVLGRASVLDKLRPLAPDVRERALDGADDLCEVYLVRRRASQ